MLELSQSRGWQAFSFENRIHRRGSPIQNLKRGKIQLIRGVTCLKECKGKEGHPVPPVSIANFVKVSFRV